MTPLTYKNIDDNRSTVAISARDVLEGVVVTNER
jgi:hypothetical protein